MLKGYFYHKIGNEFCNFMEFCNGGTLLDYLLQKKSQNVFLAQEEIIELFTCILKGLQYIRNSMGKEKLIMMHRDLKPDNIFFQKSKAQRILKIGDFGKAKTYRYEKKSLSSSETNRHYQSPEISRQSEISDKTDIWSLGVILYYLCFLEYPWKEDLTAVKIYEFQKECLDGKDLDFENKKREISNEMKALLNSMIKFKEEERINFDELFANKLFEEELKSDLKKFKKNEENKDNNRKNSLTPKKNFEKFEEKANKSANYEPNELDKEFFRYLESLEKSKKRKKSNDLVFELGMGTFNRINYSFEQIIH